MLVQRIMRESAEDCFPEHHESDPKARRMGSWNATPVAFVHSLGPAMKSLTIIRICRLLQKVIRIYLSLTKQTCLDSNASFPIYARSSCVICLQFFVWK